MATALATERVRSAAKTLQQDNKRLQAEVNAHSVLFKLVAEDLEKDNDSKSITELRNGLLKVIESVHDLDVQSAALQNVTESFNPAAEPTDFDELLQTSALQSPPFDPNNHMLLQKFDKDVWNINHAGEAAPGQEQEEIVMLTSHSGIINKTCPLTGKPVTELDSPVRSIECHHVYEMIAAADYIKKRVGRNPRKCAVPGCSKILTEGNLMCDPTLKLEIEELRARERSTQVAHYTEVDDLEDY